jgi:hypothetical protein
MMNQGSNIHVYNDGNTEDEKSSVSAQGFKVDLHEPTNISGVLQGVHQRIHNDAGVTQGDMNGLLQALRSMSVTIDGNTHSLESHPEIERNKKIWDEILRGHTFLSHQLTIVTPNVVRALVEQETTVDLRGITCLTDEDIAAFGKQPHGTLNLSGLPSLSTAQFVALCYIGCPLQLNGLTSLPPLSSKDFNVLSVAKSIQLNGLTAITSDQFEALVGTKTSLSLNGLTSLPKLTPALGSALEQHEMALACDSVREVDAEQFQTLLHKRKGDLSLRNLDALPPLLPGVEKLLQERQMRIYLSLGILKISDEDLCVLLKTKGVLTLNRLQELPTLSPKTVALLKETHQAFLCGELRRITDDQFRALLGLKNSIYLYSLQELPELSEATITMLRDYSFTVLLDGLESISDKNALALKPYLSKLQVSPDIATKIIAIGGATSGI